MDWSLREGYAWAEDKEHCEEYGRMLQADPSKVSSRAKKRGLPQVNKHSSGFKLRVAFYVHLFFEVALLFNCMCVYIMNNEVYTCTCTVKIVAVLGV